MRKTCIRCEEEKVLAEFLDPVLSRRSMKPGRAALSHVCRDCREEGDGETASGRDRSAARE